MKKLKEKEPFYASIYKRNFLKSGKKVKINKSTLGIELEVCYLIKKNFFIKRSNNYEKYIKIYFSYGTMY
jgi:2-keto-4-pentenoate hydratase